MHLCPLLALTTLPTDENSLHASTPSEGTTPSLMAACSRRPTDSTAMP